MVDPSRASNKNYTITKATAEDVPIIQSMVEAAYSKYIERIGKRPAPMDEDYYQIIHTQNVLVLKDKNNLVVGSIVLEFDPASNSMKVNNLVVHPSAQGHGYGRVMMNCAEDVARSQNCVAVTLYTNVKMYENLGVYLKMGFSETERKNQDGFDRVFFRKDL
ncbi:acetyltransferase [Penicillium canariense]|uniref:Acetyltransferase n=1 Tax=Penicillium canariense TaxID=189055 RepID=A0A9W9I6S5_9EURO|nr:acetyltransferase [Penicillium canariense]KAJ5166747.1 acetyltransferase [Penicillium canariense]